MAPQDLSFAEIRVLGSLIEKEATTPGNYPLTANALRTACNQSTSRDPVVAFTDGDVAEALAALRERGITRTVHSTSNRAIKYRHVVDEFFQLDPGELAVVSVLLLRGPQTVGELKQRTERQHGFDSLDAVGEVLAALAARPEPLVRQLDRQPGQKDARWVHLLGDAADGDDHDHGGVATPTSDRGPIDGEALSPRPVARLIRPCRHLDLLAEQYSTGLGWSISDRWDGRDGVDAVVLQSPGGHVEIELMHRHLDPEPPPPHADHLLSVTVDNVVAASDRLISVGFEPVGGSEIRAFEDLEGGRLVITADRYPGT